MPEIFGAAVRFSLRAERLADCLDLYSKEAAYPAPLLSCDIFTFPTYVRNCLDDHHPKSELEDSALLRAAMEDEALELDIEATLLDRMVGESFYSAINQGRGADAQVEVHHCGQRADEGLCWCATYFEDTRRDTPSDVSNKSLWIRIHRGDVTGFCGYEE